ncbi:hypothetical protein BT96DRAFT_944179 [Gymnopus androsaceus JB14]|uniref:Uncharacterized protein n=1 Tax=Gymnopus androsaceus JB14 TaxID=1447944 RepID=A0A6A4H7B8_9AGAR|nr:hypothetical protein BT96DRAFT_944179 [Gymnopus androsaceus JB14]
MPVEKTEAQKISPDGSTFHRSVAQVRRRIYRLFDQGVETHGISPTAEGARTDQRMHQMFTLWFSSCFNLSGCSMLPAYLCMLGPKLGTRTMVLSRFSFGYYGAKLPAILNVFSMIGWVILMSIVGGQFLTGSFPVYQQCYWYRYHYSDIPLLTHPLILHRFNSYIWIPNAVLFLTLLGAGGKNLTKVVPASSGMTASQIISFSSTIAALTLTWTANGLDFSVHHQSKASGWRIFIYTFLGLFVSNSILLKLLRRSFGSVSPAVPSWKRQPWSLMEVILELWWLLFWLQSAVSGNFDNNLHSISLWSERYQSLLIWSKSDVPRYLYSVIGTAIAIPIAIIGSSKFFATFEDIISRTTS